MRWHLRPWILLLIFSLLMTGGLGSEERISCFVIGWVDPAINPFTGFFQIDPLFTYSAEPIHPLLTNDEKRKLDRVYFPRTRDLLISDYDLMVFRNARIDHFTTRQLDDLCFVFSEGGMTAITTFGPDWDEVWEISNLRDITPVRDYYMAGTVRAYRVRFRRERQPVFLPFVELGLEQVWGEGFHNMEVKQGATVWADIMPYGLPWLVSWRPAGGDPGMQWVFPGGFDGQWFGESNPYAIDFATNLIFHSLGRPLIGDIYARREARHLIAAFRSQKIVILDMADWADTFGADTREIIEKLHEVEVEAGEYTDLYLNREYAASISGMEETFDRISEITEDAVRLKDRAMVWVFVSEWLVVTSVAMIAGFVLWSLMIERRKYREVGSTRPVRL